MRGRKNPQSQYNESRDSNQIGERELDLGRAIQARLHAAWVARPRSSATQAMRNLGLATSRTVRGLGLIMSRTMRSLGLTLCSLFLFFFFFFPSSRFFSIKVINRVSKTRFPCGRHVEKNDRPKSSLKDSRYW